jgi:hypothetical protein
MNETTQQKWSFRHLKQQRHGRMSIIKALRIIGLPAERYAHQASDRWRLQYPTFLRQTFVEWAAESTRHSFWARAYYQQQRDKGASHQAAVRALAFKWIRILFRCWQNRTPYNESVYLNALERRGSPLLNYRAQVS